MRIRFFTLGCKVNQYETQLLEELFEKNGFQAVHKGEADILVVNSCTVTATSDQKCRRLIRRLRREQPNALIALTGCMPQAAGDTGMLPPEADVITGAKNRAGLLLAVERYLLGGQRVVDISPHLPGDSFETIPASGLAGHTRAYLKIQDGCDKRCSYCIIPAARGHVRSKPPQAVREEAVALAKAGYKEIVLVGINLALYGADLGLRLPDGVAACVGLGCRLRLGSLDPMLLSHHDLARLSEMPDVCAHFHLSLQSGCDDTLIRMRRGYNAARYTDMVGAIRRQFDNPAVTTDLIVGFPGETEQEFAATTQFVEGLGLSDAHIFEFSPRPGTPAADMPGQVPPDVKKHRAGQLAKITAQSREVFLQSQVGTIAQVIAEEACRDGISGRSRNYTPVLLPGASEGECMMVRITGVCGSCCVSEALRPDEI